jgi:hypothetical protein
MNKGYSFPEKSPRPERVVDDLGSDIQLDAVTKSVRNLIKEESALPTHRNRPACNDASPRSLKQGQVAKKSKALIWFRWLVQILAHSVTTFFQRPGASRTLAILMLSIVFFVMPWFVLSLVLLSVLIASIIYFSLGPDKVGALVAAWHARLRSRDPDKAEDARSRAALWSNRISAIADCLPEKWTAGLYFPDFEKESELPEKMKTDPFDRLDARKITR